MTPFVPFVSFSLQVFININIFPEFFYKPGSLAKIELAFIFTKPIM
jgi:hypothetical protein